MRINTSFAFAILSFQILTINAHASQGMLKPIADSDYYLPESTAKIELGKVLFYDKILSGNLNISCATCHHPLTGTSDGLSLPVGEGGEGLGITRNTGSGQDLVPERVPRNSPHLFNLGAKEFAVMFHDGRVTVDPNHTSGFASPAGDQLPLGLDNPLAVQAMFPVTSGTEMAGQGGENSIADAAAISDLNGADGVWAQLALRLQVIPEYVALFQAAFPESIGTAQDIQYKDAANAIAAFEASAWRSDNSRFDQRLRGNKHALSKQETKGMKLFYGKAKCRTCHSGQFQTDQNFHAIAMPQVGPGKGHNSEGYFDGREDFGLEAVTGDVADRFKFRTPTLRNVALTAPYGHAGAYNSLEAVVRHHLSPIDSLNAYDPNQMQVPSRSDLDTQDHTVMNDPSRVQEIAAYNELNAAKLNEKQVKALISFLYTLTDSSALDMRHTVPPRVPSGLPLFD